MTATAPRETTDKAYYRGLDGVRGVAILIVFFEHWWTWKRVLPFGGAVGVNIFFVLSGFLITEILLRHRHKPLGRALKSFYWRRFLRIFPVYYVYLLALVAFHVPRAIELLPWAASYSLNIYTALTGDIGPRVFSHLWSLCIEEQFYIIWPLVILASPNRWLARVMGALCVGAIAFRIAALGTATWGTEIAIRTMPSALDALCLGGLLAFLKVFRPGLWQRIVRPGRRSTLAVGASAGLAIFLAHSGLRIYPTIERTSSAILGAMLIVAAFAYERTALVAILESRLLVFIGKISYGLYVYHLLVEYLLAPPLGRWLVEHDYFGFTVLQYNLYVVTMPVYVAAALSVATLSYYVMERPLLRLKDRQSPREISPQIAPAQR